MKRLKQVASRRKFFKQGSLFLLGTAVSRWFPGPLAFPKFPEKHPELILLGDRPVNLETPPHLLNDSFTPNDLFFVRNNGLIPDISPSDLSKWTLTIDGESVLKSVTWTIADLKKKFEIVTLALTLECGGNGRKEFNPPTEGNQWDVGAVGCAKWTGVRLRDVLNAVGLKSNAKYIGYYGKDKHLSGDPQKTSISRGVPIEKALEPESLIAWEMNGSNIPLLNGYPLRLVIGGYPASVSGKWLHHIVVRDRIHDGPKMEAPSYCVPCKPIAPGESVPNEQMCIIHNMPVRSIITYPRSGAIIPMGKALKINGHAWSGSGKVNMVAYSIDFGATWKKCALNAPLNKYAWQDFGAEIKFPTQGYFEIWVKATDETGISQPMVVPAWNPKGYLNNACHRIAVKIA
jgi:DMSO/TMAO reductase YedYZ molybdopterin-dependent catalytic subunit